MRRIAATAGLLSASSLAGLILNFAMQAYLAWRFGAGVEMDAYVAAMTLPALFAAVFIPSLSVVVIPVLVDTMQKRGAAAMAGAASSVVNATAIVLAAVVAVVYASAEALMHALVPGLAPPALALAADVLRWLVAGSLFTAVAATLTGIHQAEERFGVSALAPVVGAAGMLAFAVLLTPKLGIRGVALATVVGNALQCFVLLPALRGRYRPRLAIGEAALRRVVALAAPLVLGGLVVRATIVADRFVASLLPQGSLSHLEYANRIAAMINALFSSGIAAALYPRMSSEAAAGDLPRLRQSFAWGQRILMLFLFPALSIGWVLRVPLLQLVLERGHFSASDTEAVARVIPWFLAGVIGGALGVLQGRVYYVLGDTITPMVLGVAETGAYFLYVPLLARRFGAEGVGMANAVYLLSALVVNGAVILRKLHARGAGDLLASAARIAFAASAAGACAWAVAPLLSGPVAMLVAGSVIGAAVYVVALRLAAAGELGLVRRLREV